MVSTRFRTGYLSHISRLIQVVLILLLPPLTLSAKDAGVEYIHPVAGARMVRGETNIIVVWADVERIGSEDLEGMFKITGSRSGRRGGTAVVSDDGKTVLFQPTIRFYPGEEVAVRLRGPRGRRYAYSFHVAETSVDPLPLRGQTCCVPEVGRTLPVRGNISRLPTHIAPPGMENASAEGLTSFAISVPSDFPFVDISILDSPADGQIFLNNWGGTPYLLILENDGTPVFYRRMSAYARDFKVQPTGLLTYHVSGETNAFYAMDASYTVVDSFRCENGYVTDEHELLMRPNGHVLIIGKDYQTVDMSAIYPNGDPSAVVVGNIIQELDTEHRVVFEWRSWDHFEITDCNHVSLTAPTIDYVHMNSIEVDTDGNILVSSRHLSEVTKIDRQTGNVLWRLGGNKNEFTFVNDDLGISYQHDARSHGNNRYTVFDNGNHHPTGGSGGDDRQPLDIAGDQSSRAVEYAIDVTKMTATLVWEYEHDPVRYSKWMGNAQRLPNGNTLIGWSDGPLPKITEVRPDGTKAYELDFVDQALCYRAFRFPWSGNASVPYLLAESRRDSITLLMNTFGDTSVVRYRIYGGQSPNPTQIMDSAASSLHTLTGLEDGAFYHFRVTAVDGLGHESGFSNEVTAQVRSLNPGDNMLLNGDFSFGTQSWTLRQGEGATATFYTIGQGECKLDISDGGAQTWSVQLAQGACLLERGKEYIYEFDAYATRTRTIETKVESVVDPGKNYSRTGTTLVTGNKMHFSFQFVMEDQTDLDSRVVFNCGKYHHDVFVDNVSLREVVPTGVEGGKSGLPAEFSLHGAYPNPFNPSTSIRFSVPEPSDVRIVLYDMLGQAVSELSKDLEGAGTHDVTLDATGLASGVYICRLHAAARTGGSSFSATLKLMLLK